MKYEGQICRPPMERSSYMLPVAVGCSYNKCTFCTLFKHLKYRELPMEQIEEELKRVQVSGGEPNRIFLGDGNAFGLCFSRLNEILDLIHKYFPECMEINMDATITNISEKSDEELKILHQKGVRHLYIGIESGTEDVLKFTKKDHDLKLAYHEIERIRKFGMFYNAHIMTGVAGKGRGIENAENTARFFNETKPNHVINFSIFTVKNAPLYREVEAGNYIPATELENLIEDRRLLELLEVDGLYYDSFHDMIEFRVRGHLPQDKEKMLKKLNERIEKETKWN